MECHSGQNSCLYNRIDVFIHDIDVLITDVHVSIIDVDVSFADVHVSIIDVDVSILDSFVSISSIDVGVGCCILYRFTLSLSSMFPSLEVWGQNARA